MGQDGEYSWSSEETFVPARDIGPVLVQDALDTVSKLTSDAHSCKSFIMMVRGHLIPEEYDITTAYNSVRRLASLTGEGCLLAAHW